MRANNSLSCVKIFLALLLSCSSISTTFAASVSGTIYDSSANLILGTLIEIGVFDGDPCGSSSVTAFTEVNTVNGFYTISNVPPGTYFLKTNAPNSSIYTDDWWAASNSSAAIDVIVPDKRVMGAQ